MAKRNPPSGPSEAPDLIPDLKKHVFETAELEAARRSPTEALIGEHIGGHRVFFYPACGSLVKGAAPVDWEPLRRFTHLCDTFVFSDYLSPPYGSTDAVRAHLSDAIPLDAGLRSEESVPLHGKTVAGLADPGGLPWDVPRVEHPWGEYIRLTRTVAHVQRTLHLFYFASEAVTLYANLFTKRGIAPRILCFLHADGPFNWTRFNPWHGPLGRAVWENPLRPEIVVTHEAPPSYDWPWSRLWGTHQGWGRSFVLPSAIPVSAGANRFDFHDAEGLTVPTIGDSRVVGLCSVDPAGSQAIEDIGRDSGPSLLTALNNLAQRCREQGTDHAHIAISGFEDEGVALRHWKRQPGNPRTVTLYYNTEGELASFGPSADSISQP